MRTEAEIYRYQQTLAYYREMAKETIASAEAGSDERGKAVKLFYRCDGAIQILNWILEVEDAGFSLPPIFAERERG